MNTTSKFPTYDVLFQPTIDALRAYGSEISNLDIRQYVIKYLSLPSDIAEKPHKGRPELSELEYRLMWSRTYLRKFGLIDSVRRGYWILTDMGRNVSTVDRREIVRAVRGLVETNSNVASESSDQFGNTAVLENETESESSDSSLRSPTPLLPTYDLARQFMRLLEGVSYTAYTSMVNSIQESIGNPQAQVDWSRPDEWMLERLHGADREFAQKIWHSSRKKLNPRHTRGCWYFASKHGLLRRAEHDLLQITDRGRSFIEEVNGPVVAAIDEFEGLLTILQLVAEQGIARRSTLLPAYSEYSRSQTTFQSENVLKSSLYHRLRNLLDRKLITASGISYSISENGIAYLGNRSVVPSVRVPDEFTTHESSSELLRMADELRKEVREQLHSYLFEMDSFQFEKLIQLLLQEMGYENVYTTAPTNDKGVDVLGTIKMGISSVLEVIQVKRHRGSIGRPVLDQLRGSLHRFDAMRGTIITTGTFSKGAKDAAFERGAPPITLIDGATLLKLLLEHGIGVHKRQVEYIEFAPEKLLQFETDGD